MGFCNEYTDIGDIAVVANAGLLPVAPVRYTGKYAYIQTEDRLVYWNGTAWADASSTSAVVATQAALPTGGSRYLGRQAYIVADQRLVIWNGTGWVILSEPEQSWTPSFGNTVLGNGSLSGSYHRSDGYCDFRSSFTLGTTSSVTSATAGLPFFAAAAEMNVIRGSTYQGGVFYPLWSAELTAGAGAVSLFSYVASGTYASNGGVGGTAPAAWATGHVLNAQGRFRLQNRHSF